MIGEACKDGVYVLVVGLLLLLAVDPTTLEGTEVAAALKTEGGDESLDLGTAK